MQNFYHRYILLISLLLILCGCKDQKETKYGHRLVLNYWEMWTGFEADAMARLVDKYNQSQDEVFVRFISISNINRKLMLATAGGNPPDIAGLVTESVPSYAENGALTPLDKFMHNKGLLKDRYIPSILNTCQLHGFTWGLPTTPATVALHYNKKLFRKAGLDPERPPKTIAELEEMNEKLLLLDDKGDIKQMGHIPMEPGWWLPSFIFWFGGNYWDQQETITALSTPNKKCFQWIESYADRFGSDKLLNFMSGSGEFASPNNPFFTEEVAMVLQGPWMYNFIKQYAHKDFEWGVAPFPTTEINKDPVTLVESNVLVIPHGAKHPKEAFDFIYFINQQENLEQLCLDQKKFSPLQSTTPEFYSKHPNPYIHIFTELAKSPNATSNPKLSNWNEYKNDMSNAIGMVSMKRETVKNALKDVQKRQSQKFANKYKRWMKVKDKRITEWGNR